MFMEQPSQNATGATVTLPSCEAILIEDEYGSRVVPQPPLTRYIFSYTEALSM